MAREVQSGKGLGQLLEAKPPASVTIVSSLNTENGRVVGARAGTTMYRLGKYKYSASNAGPTAPS